MKKVEQKKVCQKKNKCVGTQKKCVTVCQFNYM